MILIFITSILSAKVECSCSWLNSIRQRSYRSGATKIKLAFRNKVETFSFLARSMNRTTFHDSCNIFFFFLFTPMEPSTGLLAAWALLRVLTVQKQFRRLLYKDYSDIQLRYTFAIYILVTESLQLQLRELFSHWETQLSTWHRSVTDANHGFWEICE